MILALNASYGRMELGRCVDVDLGYLGCSADVLHIVDKFCSGRQSCQMTVPHSEMNRASQCHNQLTQYLSAEYTCVKGTSHGTSAPSTHASKVRTYVPR